MKGGKKEEMKTENKRLKMRLGVLGMEAITDKERLERLMAEVKHLKTQAHHQEKRLVGGDPHCPNCLRKDKLLDHARYKIQDLTELSERQELQISTLTETMKRSLETNCVANESIRS